MRDFIQIDWNAQVEEDCRAIVRLALREDLLIPAQPMSQGADTSLAKHRASAGRPGSFVAQESIEQQQDWTTVSLVPKDSRGAADLVVREPGIVAGLPTVAMVLDEMQADLTLKLAMADGESCDAGKRLATLEGSICDLLTSERTILNLLGRLSGIATLASRFVDAVQGTGAHVYDTRKTTPGWRRLEKYATRCGGARNHRMGLYDAILIKDNHLAARGNDTADIAGAIDQVRQFLQAGASGTFQADMLVEVEVDTLDQLASALAAEPDVVLLDNMSIDEMKTAVAMRDAARPAVQLEASGGVDLKGIHKIASTGVERISVGALTHSARSLDIGLDWRTS